MTRNFVFSIKPCYIKLMKRNILVLAMAAAIGLAFAGCVSSSKTDDAAAAEKPECTEWVLVTLTGHGNGKAIPTSTLTLTDEGDGKYAFNGHTGINLFNGSLTAKDSSITVGDYLAVTKAAGAPDDMYFEDTLLQLLNNADSWSRSTLYGVQTLVIGSSQANLEAVYVDKASLQEFLKTAKNVVLNPPKE